MNDYSEVTCHLQKDVVNLINALNDKKWQLAHALAENLAHDLYDVSDFALEEMSK